METIRTKLRPLVSVVAPCYNEEESLREFHGRVAAACSGLTGSYEIVLVDDGSKDATWQVIEALADDDPHVVGVRLLRNHGHQLAATAGLHVANGERVMLIDADLQDPPELLGAMMACMDEGADVVYGQRVSREGETWFKLATAGLFYRMLTKLTSVPIPRDTGDFRLMSRRVVDLFLLMPERQRFIRGMVSWIGGNQVALPYERHARFAGSSKYPLSKMIRFAVDAITSFSTVPLRIAVWVGLVTAGLSMLLLLYALYQWSQNVVVAGWASIITAIAFLGGLQMLMLGVFGEYLGRLVQETKGRPLFMVKSIRAGKHLHEVPSNFSRLEPGMRDDVVAAWSGER
ncbi:glycosyltransferase [Roseomonas sp. M0104]|uniref:Glycosyltransferase n=1 Tax=Teichococcus coralli TaxID=2545983 RepID=A0A845BBM6_9PROT|nr:glycosyltransferase family 2 protein [Pseudoroseomonas coralli]MXP64561.1 glycosyltransferase [Pseudoroseomonas coralli]